MWSMEGVFSSDRVALDRTRFTPGALASGLVQSYGLGMPSLVSHDNSRPLGWTTPRVLYIEPHLTRMCGVIDVPTTAEEQARLRAAFAQFWHRQAEGRGDDLKRLRAALGDALRGDEQALPVECTAFYASGLARRACPSLFREDDDGLVEVATLDAIAPGVYRAGASGELAVFAHHFLRRSLSPLNSLNVPLLEALHDLAPTGVRPRVALDPDVVGLAVSYKPLLEHQFWWGPKFSEDLASIPPGVTVHGATETQKFFHGISRTEFFWYSRKGEHILEVEEVRDLETAAPAHDAAEAPGTANGEGQRTPFGCRYAHAIVDERSRSLTHFDGAVRLYTDEQMLERLDVHLNDAGRDKAYRKLWRIDGDVPVNTWKRVLSDYFRDNHLVGEYLGAPAAARDGLDGDGPSAPLASVSQGVETPGPSTGAREAPAVSATAAVESKVPKTDSFAGPRVTLALVPMPADCATRLLRATALKRPLEGRTTMYDSDALDIAKLIRRLGGDVTFDGEALFLAFEDLHHNLPVIWHDSPAAARLTAQALHELVGAWAREDGPSSAAAPWGGHAVSLAVAVRLPVEGADDTRVGPLPADTALLVSIRGEAHDVERLLARWDAEVQPALERQEGSVSAVADVLARLLEEWPPTHDEDGSIRGAVRSSVLCYDRVWFDESEIQIMEVDGSRKVIASIDPERRPALAARLRRGRLAPAEVFVLLAQRCMLCASDYGACEHVKGVDAGCAAEVLKMRRAGFIATDRPMEDPDGPPPVRGA